MVIDSIRKDFPILSREIKGRPVVYLDAAATAQKPLAVIEAMQKFYSFENANVHRGIYHLSESATEQFEGVRDKIAAFIGAPDRSEIIFTSGTTQSINLVMRSWGERNVERGDTIVVTRMEHHANFVPWQVLARRKDAHFRIVNLTPEWEIDWTDFEDALAQKPKFVAFTAISNVLGGQNPVRKMVKAAKAAGAVVLVDGAQMVPHREVNIADFGPVDFFAFSGHKLCGPTGVGVLWGRKSLLEQMEPYQYGGSMILQVEDQKTTFADVPARFEAGTPPIAQVIGLGVATDYIQSVGWNEIEHYEAGLAEEAYHRLRAVPGLEIIGPPLKPGRIPLFSFVLDGVHPHDLATYLDYQNIAIRAGHHCAQPLMAKVGVVATTRASFAFYNRSEEIDILVEAIKGAKKYFSGVRV